MEEMVQRGIMKMLLGEREKFRQKLIGAKKIFKEELRVEDGAIVGTYTTDCCVANSVNNGNRVDRFEKILAKFVPALVKAEAGTYGICTKCKEQISLGRLKAVPFAETCTECKNLGKFVGNTTIFSSNGRASENALMRRAPI